jgi:hypothetical protein
MTVEAPPPLRGPTNLVEALEFYAAAKLPVTPVKPGDKSGRIKGWSNSKGAAPSDFRVGENVGVLNGTEPLPEWFFYDVDIDANSNGARSIVEDLLPPTDWRYGRLSKPRSHANYLAKGKLRTRKYTGVDDGSTIELRGFTQKNTHTLSVGPGSTHTSGEPIRFVEPLGQPGYIAVPDDLDKGVQYAAVGIAIFQVWPTQNRHRLRLAFAKVLLEHGVPQERTTAILTAVMKATNSDEDDVAPTVSDTDDTLRAGQPTEGASAILDVLGESAGGKVLKAISRILRSRVDDDGTSIFVNQATPEMIDRAWARLAEVNDPPGIFRRQNEVVILHASANTCLEQLYAERLKFAEPAALQHIAGFRVVDTDTFREIVGRLLPCVQTTANGKRTRVYPPRDFANLMLAGVELPLPEPLGFTSVPFFTPAGHLVTVPGLHRETGMFYQPPPGFALPYIPEHPTKVDAAKAVAVLDEMVWQFPFKGRLGQHPYLDIRDNGDWQQTPAYANMLAFPLTVILRSLFLNVPLFLVDKPTTRTGASLLVQCWCYVLTGVWPSEAEWDGSESERRKFLTAILMTGAPIIFLDEVDDLRSTNLNKILTGKNARIGRVLGATEVTNPHNFSTFVATGNNPRFPKDMAGRMCRVRLDADMLKPSDREGWDKKLPTWVPEHRMELLAALYVLVRAWFVAQCPKPNETRALNGFEEWSDTVGGILSHAGLAGFLANKRDVEDDADDGEEADSMDALIEAWYEKYPDALVATAEIVRTLGLLLPNVDASQKWTAGHLGNWLRLNRDKRRVLGDGREVRIEHEGGEGRRWKLRLLAAPTPDVPDTPQNTVDHGM